MKVEYQSRHERRIAQDFITGGDLLRQLTPESPACGSRRPALPPAAAPASRGTVREAWVGWLAPHFADGQPAYFTGTYSDDYGFAHGCMASRNVQKDFRRFLVERGLMGHEFVNAVEQHRYRDILHCHAILAGDFAPSDLALLKAEWAVERGHARVLPVQDGCASYVTKYALKGDTDAFDWWLR